MPGVSPPRGCQPGEPRGLRQGVSAGLADLLHGPHHLVPKSSVEKVQDLAQVVHRILEKSPGPGAEMGPRQK